MLLLKIGDKIIYPNQGLGVIVDIKEENQFGEKSKLYHLKILSNNTLVMVSSSCAEEIGIRKPITARDVKRLLEFMRNGNVDVSMNWKGRYKEHLNLLRSGSILDMALVLKSLFYLNLIKPLSFREKKMMEKVKELIVSELSEVSSLSHLEIEQKVMENLALCFKGNGSHLDT